jgi:diguanylate cyclase (GGDEF)-like protein
VSERNRLSFLGHLPLISAGGQRIGFISVLDEAPRAGLTEAQTASLTDIASMIMADRQREQRHLHLMHVANRAMRIDQMLRLVSEAVSCASGLTGLLEELCVFHGAAVGRIWELVRPQEPLSEISQYDGEEYAGDDEAAKLAQVASLGATAAEAIRRNEPHTIGCPQSQEAERAETLAASRLLGQVCVPIWVQQQRFGISLGFTTERPDLDMVTADIASLADTIRPALFRKVTEERIRFVAHHDHLTQLANRLMFQERLGEALASARRNNRGFALLYLDLDGFKQVNDTRGHEIGDKLLVAVAKRLRENLREGDTVARMGGDEFAIIESSGSQPGAAVALAQRLIAAVGQPYELDGRRSRVSVSIGIAVFPTHGESPDALLRNADTALYRAKEAGRNTFQLFDPAMRVQRQQRSALEQDLRTAITKKQFTLAYQPICDIETMRVVGFEALLRWNHPKRKEIPPTEFIDAAEAAGLIVPLGRWALETACAEAAKWDPPVCVSVNLSPLQFGQADLPEQIATILNRIGLRPDRLDLEVTEGLLLDESEVVLHTIRKLQEQGVRITLDDFGTAYAGLSYLRRLPFDRVKIDQSFVRGICDDASTLAVVRSILSLGEQMQVAVVAEGVETERELATLRGLGCRLVQGFLPGTPRSADQARALLRVQGGERWEPVLVPAAELGHPASQWTGSLETMLSAVDPAPYEQSGGGE